MPGPRRILDIQQRARELGRIRLGGHKGARAPGRPLDHFRFTSPNEEAIRYAAGAYGGQVQEWEGQWEVFTEVSEIEIGVPGNIDPISQSYEDWTGGRCVRRCDSVTEWISGEPCKCDPENRTCKPVLRANLLVPAIPIVGVWRMESHGYNANSEWIALVEFAQQVPGHARGVLRLEKRSDKREDPKEAGKTITRNYIVPVIDIHVSVAAIMAGGNGVDGVDAALHAAHPRRLTPGERVPDAQPALPAETGGIRVQDSAPDLPPPAALPANGGEIIDERDERPITEQQRKRMFAIAKGAGVSSLVVSRIARYKTGGARGVGEMQRGDYEAIVASVETYGAHPDVAEARLAAWEQAQSPASDEDVADAVWEASGKREPDDPTPRAPDIEGQEVLT